MRGLGTEGAGALNAKDVLAAAQRRMWPWPIPGSWLGAEMAEEILLAVLGALRGER